MTIAAASSTNWADAMDFHAAMMCQDGHPALACCALDGTLRTSTSNWCSLSCSSRCFQLLPTVPGMIVLVEYSQRRDPADGGDCTSCTRLVQWTPRVPASPALPALPHTQYTHTQSHNRRHGSRLGAGRRGWDAAEQRSRGRLAVASEMRCRHAAPAASQCLTDLAAAGSGTGRASARVGRTAQSPPRGAAWQSAGGSDGTPVDGSSSVARRLRLRASQALS